MSRGRRRRRQAAVVLAVLAVAAGAGAVAGGAGEETSPSASERGAVATPVLSPRRVPALLAAGEAERRLDAGLDGVLAASPPSSCLVVREGERTLYEAAADRALVPASTLKLVTATAVLDGLGEDTRLRTTVVAEAPPRDGVVDDLWVVGGGDPVLGTADWAASFRHQPALVTPLEALADDVVAAGVRVVRGRLQGDESRYDAVRTGPDWPASAGSSGHVGPLSALFVNDGFARGPRGPIPFADPAAGAAGVLADLLRLRGVQVAATGAGPAPEGATGLAEVASPPMGELVASMVRESDNASAELLTKELGLQERDDASTAAGVAALRGLLAGHDLPLDGVTIVDGSGLSRSNRLTCGLLARLVGDGRPADALDGALPVAGRTGSLTERFLGSPLVGRLRGKTGSLNGVEALAGVVDTDGGGDVSFAYLLNGPGTTDEGAAALQDRLGEVLLRHPDADLGGLGPRGVAPE